MKTQNTNLLTEISDSRLQDLMSTVKETVASTADHTAIKTFSAADLWRIQSNRRVRSIRKFAA